MLIILLAISFTYNNWIPHLFIAEYKTIDLPINVKYNTILFNNQIKSIYMQESGSGRVDYGSDC